MERRSDSAAGRGSRAPSPCLKIVLDLLHSCVIKIQTVGPKTLSAIHGRYLTHYVETASLRLAEMVKGSFACNRLKAESTAPHFQRR